MLETALNNTLMKKITLAIQRFFKIIFKMNMLNISTLKTILFNVA